jgi:hypothetical protein
MLVETKLFVQLINRNTTRHHKPRHNWVYVLLGEYVIQDFIDLIHLMLIQMQNVLRGENVQKENGLKWQVQL